MPPQLVAVALPVTGLFRVARGIEPFAPPDWAYAHDDGTFGNRFDDPRAAGGTPAEKRFRVIYCASSRAGAFGETLARFRVSLPVLEALGSIDDDESVADALTGAVDPASPRRGLVKAEWRLARRIGQTVLDPTLRFADVAAVESMQYLRTALAPLANRLGLPDVDLSALTSQQRLLT